MFGKESADQNTHAEAIIQITKIWNPSHFPNHPRRNPKSTNYRRSQDQISDKILLETKENFLHCLLP